MAHSEYTSKVCSLYGMLTTRKRSRKMIDCCPRTSSGRKTRHPCNKSPSAIAVTIVAAIAVSRAAAIAGVRAYESVPLYAVPL